MNIPAFKSGSGLLSPRSLIGLLFFCAMSALVSAGEPAWWSQRGIKNPSAPANDFAAINQGQLKNLATAAVAELDERLPEGAGTTLHGLVTKWATPTAQTDDFAPVNLGQLKAVAKPFYDRLIQTGYTAHYPWTTSTNAANDYAIANIGQAKNLFAFDLGGGTPSVLGIVAGNNQSAPVNAFLPKPLTVKVSDSKNRPLKNVVVTFTAVGDGGRLSVSNKAKSPLLATIQVTTDSKGIAKTYAKLQDGSAVKRPWYSPRMSVIVPDKRPVPAFTASVSSSAGKAPAQVTFTASAKGK